MKYINPNFVNTSDSYSKSIFFGNNCIVIPYININLIPSNPVNRYNCFVDYCFYIFSEVRVMHYGANKFEMSLNFNICSDQDAFFEETILVGGYMSLGAEVKIRSKEHLLYIPESAKISSSVKDFIPIDTPNFKQTMELESVNEFLNYRAIPTQFKELLGNEFNNMIIW